MKLIEHSPHLLEEWDYEKNKDIDINKITHGSKKKIWWECIKEKHSWDASPNERTNNKTGCPYCSGKRVCKDSCLETTHPELLKEWDYDRNTIKPSEITAGSDKKIWWNCPKSPNHIWDALVRCRTGQNQGCPYCSGRRVCKDNCLKTTHPELLKEWNYERNKILPTKISYGSDRKVWWKCKKGHEWKMSPGKRIRQNHTCSACRQEKYRLVALCIICEKQTKIHKIDLLEQGICKSCYYKHFYKQKKRKCDKCGKVKKIISSATGIDLCETCYERPKKKCILCENIGIVKKYTESGPVCSGCYIQPKRKCNICKQVKEIYSTKNGDICKTCYGKTYIQPKKICSGCEKEKKISNSKLNLCNSCCNYPKHKKICAICKKRKMGVKRTNKGTICRYCYVAERMKVDERFYVSVKVRDLVRSAFKLYSSTGKIRKSKDYGIDYEAIIKHLGPCPGNREDYHIDHFFPLSAFNFDDPIHIKAAFAPENHQWLTKKENLQKGNKYDQEQFDKYIKEFLL